MKRTYLFRNKKRLVRQTIVAVLTIHVSALLMTCIAMTLFLTGLSQAVAIGLSFFMTIPLVFLVYLRFIKLDHNAQQVEFLILVFESEFFSRVNQSTYKTVDYDVSKVRNWPQIRNRDYINVRPSRAIIGD